ncbi:unnamed protein product (macronuclear) [Paramecium tetraurelia]|uniref:Uncharacterized protein n=1 Tax=Paramecium tetraurelia TaxID=5888 RepID=A0DGU6_PARTE|nr:uncharacterized protein GSPATT00002392001 [Paramecium tetraurelia]CAK82263.1 unnamed protein product [Paramecium tetraurelia]|eukprot:XP_001449660.1 hypothetical protein (macronuclear) [Paramecium tetraurelia strain d4-2]
MQQKNLYINNNKQNQDNNQHEVVNAINTSPEKQIQTLQDARQNQQQLRMQNKQQNNLNLEELNYKIQDIQKLNLQLDEKSNKLFGQIKQDVSNLQTAITQNISPSERGLRKKETIKNGINLDDLLDYEQGSINLDELASYRGSQEYKVLDNYQNF